MFRRPTHSRRRLDPPVGATRHGVAALLVLLLALVGHGAPQPVGAVALPAPAASSVAPLTDTLHPPARDDWMRPPPPAQPTWVRTEHKAGLWSGPDRDALQFTEIPAGSYLRPLGPRERGRWLVYYPGDGQPSRVPGQAWADRDALAPSGAPPWVSRSEVPNGLAHKPSAASLVPRRASYVAPPAVSARNVAIVDGATGLLLYGLDPHERVAPASVTKIATALVALERSEGRLTQKIDITVSGAEMAVRDGSSVMGLEPGDRLTLRTLLYGLLLPSGNDVAEQLALSLAGSRETYVAWMNQKVEALGLRDTHFVTPSGMDADGHYASAYDLAQLAREAMSHAQFREIVGSAEFADEGYTLRNTNRLLDVYPGLDGVKTGYTDRAGQTLVASVQRESGARVFVCVMGSNDRFGDTTALFDWVWEAFSWQEQRQAA